MTNYRVQTGGKLYLTGEYAILSPGQKALIHYIPILMTATIAPSQTIELTSDLFDYSVGMTPDDNYALIQDAISNFSTYIGKTPLTLSPFFLTISGKLEEEGKKFGIGSSGSVTLLVLKALAAFHELDLSPDLLFKLATYTLLKRGDNGSMGDLACIAYEQLVLYQSFDRQKVKSQIDHYSLQDLLKEDWGYKIEALSPRLTADFLVGWTRVPSISKLMIEKVKNRISSDFLAASQSCTQAAVAALKSGDQADFKQAIQESGQLLSQLDSAIYHPKLKSLVEATQDLEAVAKSSGSGGGDCGIAFVFEKDDVNRLIGRWQEEEISLLYQESWRKNDQSKR
ncbi:phosphomevalonate kinase [Streptococcus ictaluri]|uniref:phosphomevalonate kinase n=1 Tax=Streptococcus ictaluri 707-05 TaxID=764299 RepID=G5K3J7_9STRE|nr:phosphomevalonate kinase [Streptococcus ictaluri]EHI69848.1 phosphomevalonate kinase [Streptococcus ictaluri 707-05]